MAANPMQRKARNAFLLGMIITLIICAIIGALLYFVVLKNNTQKQADEGTLVYAYRLKNDIKSGQMVTSADVEEIVVTAKAVPAGAFPSRTKTKNEAGKEVWQSVGFPGIYVAKVDLYAGTIISQSLVTTTNASIFTKDADGNITGYASNVRYVEYNMLTMPTNVNVGDFVDIRVTFPNGSDLIVVSKKEIKTIFGNTVGFVLTEDEIVMMESAIVESYIMESSKIYVAKYIEPGVQTAAVKTYVPTEAVRALINDNANIVATAREALTARFSGNVRNATDIDRYTYSLEEKENLEEAMQDEIENAKKAREAYLSGLASY